MEPTETPTPDEVAPVDDVRDGDDREAGIEEASPSSGKGRRSVAISTGVGLLLGGLATYFVVRTLVDGWDEASEQIRDAELVWLAAGLVCAAAGMTAIGWGWRFVLRLLGVDAPLGRIVAWYYVGELGKYLPGGVWPVLGRGELARRGGVPRTRAYASVAMSLGVLYLAAMFVAAAFLPFAISSGGANPWMLFLLALPVGVGVLHHDVLGWLVGMVGRLTGRTIEVEIPPWRDSLMLVVRYVPTWLFIGVGTWAVARSLTPDASFARIMFASVLSWVAGFLAVPVPAGGGVREAVLVASSGLDGGLAAATAIVARVLFIAVDVVGAAISAPIAGRKRGGARVGPLHPGDA